MPTNVCDSNNFPATRLFESNTELNGRQHLTKLEKYGKFCAPGKWDRDPK